MRDDELRVDTVTGSPGHGMCVSFSQVASATRMMHRHAVLPSTD